MWSMNITIIVLHTVPSISHAMIVLIQPVSTILDDKFIEIQTSVPKDSFQTTNYTSTYDGTKTPFDDRNNDGPATGMILYTKSVLGNTFVCSGIDTTYNSKPRNDTFHGVSSKSSQSLSANNNTPFIYRM